MDNYRGETNIQNQILVNPANPCPPEQLTHLVGLTVTYVDFSGAEQTGIIEVHNELMADVRKFFELAYMLKFPIEKVVRSSDPAYGWDDQRLMTDNATSGFNYRHIPGTGEMSLHAQGRALDVNTRLNPYIRYQDGDASRALVEPTGAVWNPEISGTLYDGHPLVELMKQQGWEWGGDWPAESGRTDYQHFQKA